MDPRARRPPAPLAGHRPGGRDDDRGGLPVRPLAAPLQVHVGGRGLVLLALTFVFGSDVNGSRLTLQIGPLSGQPSELLKVILVVFFAAYLAENRVLLADARVRVVGRLTVPPLPYLAPIAAMLALALGIVVVQRDLGAALLFYAVFLALLFLATGRLTDVVLGLLLFVAGFLVLAAIFPHVQERVAIWLDPWADPLGAGFQLIQALHAFARGGLVGTGLGAGLPEIAGRPPIPASPHRLPAGGDRGGARDDRGAGGPGRLPRARGARPADRGVVAGRLPGTAGRRPRARDRRARRRSSRAAT